MKTPKERATKLWQRMIDNQHNVTWSSFAAESEIQAAMAEAYQAGLEAAQRSMNPMLRDMISRGRAVDLIKALPNPYKGDAATPNENKG